MVLNDKIPYLHAHTITASLRYIAFAGIISQKRCHSMPGAAADSLSRSTTSTSTSASSTHLLQPQRVTQAAAPQFQAPQIFARCVQCVEEGEFFR
jgi:hypothetical protein